MIVPVSSFTVDAIPFKILKINNTGFEFNPSDVIKVIVYGQDASLPVTFILYDSKGQEKTSTQRNITDPSLVIYYSFTIPHDAILGLWKLEVQNGKYFGTLDINVTELTHLEIHPIKSMNNTYSMIIYDDQPIISNMGNIIKYEYPHSDLNDDGFHGITFDNPTSGDLIIKIPKTLPIFAEIISENGIESHSILPDESVVSMYAIDDNENELFIESSENDCFVNYNVALNNSTSVEIMYAYILIAPVEWLYVEPEQDCYEIFDKLKHFDEFRTCNDSHTPQFNNRIEQVCINSESVSKLTERGYLI